MAQGIRSVLLAGDRLGFGERLGIPTRLPQPEENTAHLSGLSLLSKTKQSFKLASLLRTGLATSSTRAAEEVAPRQLATMAAEFIKSIAPQGTLSRLRIVKDKDLLSEGWEGIYAVGRGSERTSAMLQLDLQPNRR